MKFSDPDCAAERHTSAQVIIDLQDEVRKKQEKGSVSHLSVACRKLLLANNDFGMPHDVQAKRLIATILLLGADEIDAGHIVASFRGRPALLQSIALEIDAAVQDESTSNRKMLLALLNLSINRHGFMLRVHEGACNFVDICAKDGELSLAPLSFTEDASDMQGTEHNSSRGGKPFKVVSFYTTHNEYAQFAERLRLSLTAHGVPHELHAVDATGPWEVVCTRKAKFMLDCWASSDCPVVWIDADATIEQYPELFGSIAADFAIHKWDGYEFGSGTLFFGKTENAHHLLKQWVLRCEADPVTWDQIHLQSAWCDIAATKNLRTHWLPRSYLQIFDAKEEAPAVIKHWQASRALKADGRVTGIEPLFYTPLGADLRRLSIPWRSVESMFWIEEGVRHIIPETGQAFPEGFDVGDLLKQCLDSHLPVVEIGCGVGRIAGLFSAGAYIGVDVNPYALIAAKKANPDHLFRIADVGLQYPSAPAAFVYTVLLHISDDEIDRFMAEVATGRSLIIIAELMDRRWRRTGSPPVFNRDAEDYILIMQRLGFKLTKYFKPEYERYAVPPFNVGKDSRLTSLVFDRTPT